MLIKRKHMDLPKRRITFNMVPGSTGRGRKFMIQHSYWTWSIGRSCRSCSQLQSSGYRWCSTAMFDYLTVMAMKRVNSPWRERGTERERERDAKLTLFTSPGGLCCTRSPKRRLQRRRVSWCWNNSYWRQGIDSRKNMWKVSSLPIIVIDLAVQKRSLSFL